MTIGWALLIIAALYLIERHKLWRRTAQVAGVLLVLAVLGIVGIILYDNHEVAERRKRQAAAVQMEKAKFDPIQPGAGDPIPVGAQIEIPCAKWMAQDKNGQCWKEVGAQLVDCFDKRTGKLASDPYAEFGGTITACGPNYIQKPAGQCKQLVKSDVWDQAAANMNNQPDCILLPVR